MIWICFILRNGKQAAKSGCLTVSRAAGCKHLLRISVQVVAEPLAGRCCGQPFKPHQLALLSSPYAGAAKDLVRHKTPAPIDSMISSAPGVRHFKEVGLSDQLISAHRIADQRHRRPTHEAYRHNI